MAPADIFPARKSRNVKKKKRERERLIAIEFSIYIQIPSAPTFPYRDRISDQLSLSLRLQ